MCKLRNCVRGLIVLAIMSSTLPMQDIQLCRGVGKKTSKFCEDNRRIYPVHRLLEDALVSDKEQLFSLKQTIFPPDISQYWNVDRVDIMTISCTLQVDQPCNKSTVDTPGNLTLVDLVWTNSLLYGLFPIHQLTSIDPDLTKQIVDLLIHSEYAGRQIALHFQVKRLPCTATKQDVLNSLIVLSSWIKAYSKAQGLPSSWDESQLGYISIRKSTRFYNEPYTTEAENIHFIQLALLLLFISINTVIPVVLPFLGHQLQAKLNKMTFTPFVSMNAWVAASTMATCNVIYILLTIRALGSYEQTTIAADITIIAKMIIVPTAFIIELIGAICTAKRLATASNQSSLKRRIKLGIRIMKAVAVWQVYIFTHIILGMCAIPLCIYLFISPGLTIISVGAMAAIFISVHIIVLSIASIKWCSRSPKQFLISFLLAVRQVLMLAVAVLTILLYYSAVINGVNQSSSVQFILSLLPAVPLSIAVWFIKQKIFGKKKREIDKEESLHRATSQESTSSEMLSLSLHTDRPNDI